MRPSFIDHIVLNKDLGGLNHLAFGVRTAEEPRALGKVLNEADIKNSGVRMDKYGNKQFIWFDDPDGTGSSSIADRMKRRVNSLLQSDSRPRSSDG